MGFAYPDTLFQNGQPCDKSDMLNWQQDTDTFLGVAKTTNLTRWGLECVLLTMWGAIYIYTCLHENYLGIVGGSNGVSVDGKMAVTVGGMCLAGVVPAPQPHL